MHFLPPVAIRAKVAVRLNRRVRFVLMVPMLRRTQNDIGERKRLLASYRGRS
jgi:hypothetical protein